MLRPVGEPDVEPAAVADPAAPPSATATVDALGADPPAAAALKMAMASS